MLMDVLRPPEKRERTHVGREKSRIGRNNSRQEGKSYHRPYWYDRKKLTTTSWNVSTWAKYLRHSSIEKNGSAAADKTALPK
jgi:hypothetical protein